jgi:hypothetical protein
MHVGRAGLARLLYELVILMKAMKASGIVELYYWYSSAEQKSYIIRTHPTSRTGFPFTKIRVSTRCNQPLKLTEMAGMRPRAIEMQ